jgi:hypothetical protein
MRRELVLVFRAPSTWIVLAVAALLCGHSTLVAIDVFSSASRSAGALMLRQMDPLSGIVRPALGGLELSTVVLLPLVCVRSLATEKERGSFRPLCLVVGSPVRVVLRKLVAALAAASLLPLLAGLLLVLYVLVGGALDAIETMTALAAHLLHALLLGSIAVASASFGRTHAQAIALALVFSLASWAIDASSELAALAWLARAESFSIDAHLASADRGVFALGDLVWLASACAGAAVLACIGARFDTSRKKRALFAAATFGVTVALLSGSGEIGLRRDWTEQRRASLPPAVEAKLRDLGPIGMTLHFDRDDARRRELENDVIAKLRIARPDLRVITPYDTHEAPAEGARDEEYGTIVLEVGSARRTTRSTSRKEIVTLLFEAAGVPLPSYEMPPYDGHPAVIEGRRRTIFAVFAYGVIPCGLVVLSMLVRRRR